MNLVDALSMKGMWCYLVNVRMSLRTFSLYFSVFQCVSYDCINILGFPDPLSFQMLQYARKKRSGSLLSTKSSFSTGYRYHEGHMLTVPSLPSPEGSKTYLFEHLVGKE